MVAAREEWNVLDDSKRAQDQQFLPVGGKEKHPENEVDSASASPTTNIGRAAAADGARGSSSQRMTALTASGTTAANQTGPPECPETGPVAGLPMNWCMMKIPVNRDPQIIHQAISC